jgi:hypothetical protein
MRVMAWNLENFKDSGWWTASFMTPLLLKVLHPFPLAPKTASVDVFGVIEVYNRAGGGPPGTPLPNNSAGAQGCLRLLNELRTRNGPDTDWKLVPPLSLGDGRRDEAIAVFYNAKKVTFEGPNQWDVDRGESVPTPRLRMQGRLPPPWDNSNISIAPEYYAPRVKFYTDTEYTQEITFPDDGHRRPCLVRFRERGGQRQLVDVFFFHTSPPLRQDPDGPQNPAFLACQYLQLVKELTFEPMRRGVDVSVVMGDFNVDANRPERWNNSLGALLANQYSALLPATVDDDQAVPTMMRERNNVGVPPDPIPGPRCDQFYYRQYAIDNALFRPQNAQREGAALDLTRGTDAEFNQWRSVMAETITQIRAWPHHLTRWVMFASIDNWYQNRLRSDHVPVAIKVSRQP